MKMVVPKMKQLSTYRLDSYGKSEADGIRRS
jgi:hypothetical protein